MGTVHDAQLTCQDRPRPFQEEPIAQSNHKTRRLRLDAAPHLELREAHGADQNPQETDRSRPAPRQNKRRLLPREIHPPRPPQHTAPLVGAAPAGRGAGGALLPTGRRPLRSAGRVPHRGGTEKGTGPPLQDHRGHGAVGEHDQRARPGEGPRRDPQELAPHLRRQPQPPARGRTVRPAIGCPPSTTPSPAAAPSPSRPSAWAWRATPATSTPSPC